MEKNLTNILFYIYFVVLFVERMQSLIRSYINKTYVNDGLTVYMYVLTIVSVVATTIFLIVRHKSIDYDMLCIAAGCMLFSGMVHTD